MQPIILLAIVGIAGGAMSIGFLGNTIDLSVQQIGVGDEFLDSPISAATIDFVIARASGTDGSDTTQTHNVISVCKITADKDILAGSHVFCKLTGVNGFVVAEGVTWVNNNIPAHQLFTVAISAEDFAANKVQNVHDVVLVVQGPSQLSGQNP